MTAAKTPLPIRIGGLMRCCIQTYDTIAPSAEMTKNGDTLQCNWCSSRMIVRDEAWEWDQGWAAPPEHRIFDAIARADGE